MTFWDWCHAHADLVDKTIDNIGVVIVLTLFGYFIFRMIRFLEAGK